MAFYSRFRTPSQHLSLYHLYHCCQRRCWRRGAWFSTLTSGRRDAAACAEQRSQAAWARWHLLNGQALRILPAAFSL
jgi:hypothetical protein